MDPLSIATGFVSLTSNVTSLLLKITLFVSEVRNARKDMDAVVRELISLQLLSLNNLSDDDQRRGVAYPDAIKKQLKQIIVNCDIVTIRICVPLGWRQKTVTPGLRKRRPSHTTLSISPTALNFLHTMPATYRGSKVSLLSTKYTVHFPLLSILSTYLVIPSTAQI